MARVDFDRYGREESWARKELVDLATTLASAKYGDEASLTERYVELATGLFGAVEAKQPYNEAQARELETASAKATEFAARKIASQAGGKAGAHGSEE